MPCEILRPEAPRDGASQPAALEGDRCGASKPAAQDDYIIHGSLPTQLRAMENQRASIILRAYEDCAAVPDEHKIASTFQDVEYMHSTDLCPPNIAALREHRLRHLPWLTSHHRCAVHRLRTAELATLKVDPMTDSFFMNLTLSLRLVSGQAPFRRRVQVWAKSVRIVQGERPDHVMAWREEVM